MCNNSMVRRLAVVLLIVSVAAFCHTPVVRAAALWYGLSSNNFNDSANWVDDDSKVGPKNPSGANCYLYNTGAGHLTDMNVTADISVFSVAIHTGTWDPPTSAVTIGSSDGYAITLLSSEAGLKSNVSGLGLLTINSKLNIGGSSTDPMELAASSDIVVNGDVSSTTRNMQKTGNATLTLGGDVTPNGRHLVVGAGTVTLGSGGSWTVHAYDGDTWTGSIYGDGALNLDGTLKVDGADATKANSWNMIANNSLTESYGSSFAVTMANGSPFTNNGGVWTYVDGSETWSFDQSTGTLTFIPEPGAIVLLSTGLIGLLAYAWRKRK